MIIYKFSIWSSNGKPYTIKEVEVEEKPKTYIARGARINKDDIDKLQYSYDNIMFRLDNNPKPYIEAMVELKRRNMESATERLKQATADFNKWFDLKIEVTDEQSK